MRKVIVTGGSRGIGAAIVRKFAKNGDAVAFLYKNSDEKAKKLADETGATAIKCDVSVPDDVKRAVGEATAALSGVDVLVNCAGVALIKLFTDVTDDEWRKIIDTDLSGTFYAWVFQFVGEMNIVAPGHVKDAYAEYLQEAIDDVLGT